jgi:hypothetical protein
VIVLIITIMLIIMLMIMLMIMLVIIVVKGLDGRLVNREACNFANFNGNFIRDFDSING